MRLTLDQLAMLSRGGAMLAAGGAVTTAVIAEILSSVHERENRAGGELTIAIVKRRVRPETLMRVSAALAGCALELQLLATRLETIGQER